MQVAVEKIMEFDHYLDTQNVEVYGVPNDAVLGMMKEIADQFGGSGMSLARQGQSRGWVHPRRLILLARVDRRPDHACHRRRKGARRRRGVTSSGVTSVTRALGSGPGSAIPLDREGGQPSRADRGNGSGMPGAEIISLAFGAIAVLSLLVILRRERYRRERGDSE